MSFIQRNKPTSKLFILFCCLYGCCLAAPWSKLTPADSSDLQKASKLSGFQEVKKLTKRPQPNAKLGKQLFFENCSVCHGPTAEGDGDAGSALDPKPANLTAASAYKHGSTLVAIFRTIKYGVDGTGMAPWQGRMTDEECWQVAEFVKTVQKK